jgi:peroxiredoxin
MSVGTVAPEFEATGPDGKPWRLSDSLSKNAAVLVFYRGDW